MRRLFETVGAWGLAFALAGAKPAFADEPISFARDIRPILSDKCFACHGPDEHARESDLRLDVRENAVGHGSLIPGDANESEVLRRMLSEDSDERMPPPHTNKALTESEITLIRRWIDDGAPYETHWAYRPLSRPKVPAIKHDRNGGPIDAFLLDRMAGRGLDFAQQADRVSLVRRVYLDLLGVPPTSAEVDAFVSDDSDRAFASLIDRLLDDRRFGERMAVYWLDLVRYADTIGYHSDTSMEVSAYRDYVIESFNANKPFDQFTIEQLAGDLLPEASETQRIASGYNRLLQTTEEGGAQAKEYVAIYAADRVRNVSGVWMGSTVGCAQCHDHKYDPFTTRDFYSLAAFFSDIKETAVGKRKPNLKIYSKSDRDRIDKLNQEIASLQVPELLESNRQLADEVAAGQSRWEAEAIARAESGESLWKSPVDVKATASGGVELIEQPDGTLLSSKGNPDKGTYTLDLKSAGPIHAIRLEVFSDSRFPNQGFSRGNGNIVLTGLDVLQGDKPVKLGRAAADYEQNSWPVSAAIDGKKTTGWAIDGHHRRAEKRTAVFYPAEPIDLGEQGSLTVRMRHESGHGRHLVGRFRVSLSGDPAATADGSQPIDEDILAVIRTPAADRTAKQTQQLRDHYREVAPELVPWKQKLTEAKKRLQDFEAGIRTMLVTEPLPEPRMTRILPRGNWLDDSGEVVQPAVPEFLPRSEIGSRRANRLDLANWLVDKENPLTARTFVNRLWKLYFGAGLSRNLDDLGGQGSPPTHPALLDWLAVEFRDSGWDVKHMVRLIVNSSAYSQSSVAPRSRQVDSQNEWLARQGRWRLEAEFVRDTLLSISGQLSDQVGGPSVKPYQPAGYWRHLNFPKRKWQADQGASLYRRSLYTFWCRTFLHPAMLAFDATSREECTAQRARSNIPQQALVLLNDPAFLEASRAFAERIVASGSGVEERIRWAFIEAVSRSPREDEMQLLTELFEQQSERFDGSREDAESLIGVGASEPADGIDPEELAAWTQVARAIFNLYETTSRF